IFCVTGIACAGAIDDGNCPGAQDGLAFGSFCDLVRTGVYGCRPYTALNQKPAFTVPPTINCAGNPAGSTPVSVVGAMQDFCAPEPVCSANRFGNCPGTQSGLTQATSCTVLPNGVHGCVFAS
uniref:Uncharacterized protein n=1 Tax=Globisporangium ultimum (strain ATCC 200006 / CBS 805.95 / DAOM BR144) TaxID=431595 RepID=K3WKJ6_GLOUD